MCCTLIQTLDSVHLTSLIIYVQLRRISSTWPTRAWIKWTTDFISFVLVNFLEICSPTSSLSSTPASVSLFSFIVDSIYLLIIMCHQVGQKTVFIVFCILEIFLALNKASVGTTTNVLSHNNALEGALFFFFNGSVSCAFSCFVFGSKYEMSY